MTLSPPVPKSAVYVRTIPRAGGPRQTAHARPTQPNGPAESEAVTCPQVKKRLWRAAVCVAARLQALIAPARTFLGHLRHHVEPNRPHQLGVVMSEVSLRRVEELLLRNARRASCAPTLAVGDPICALCCPSGSSILGNVRPGARDAAGLERRSLVNGRPGGHGAGPLPFRPLSRYVSDNVARQLVPRGTESTRVQLCVGRLSGGAGRRRACRKALRGKQVPLLLAYLVLNRDRPVGREELIGALSARNQAPRAPRMRRMRGRCSRGCAQVARRRRPGRAATSSTLRDAARSPPGSTSRRPPPRL